MAEHDDTSAALRRLEAALNRIAAQVATPRPHFATQARPDQDLPANDSQHVHDNQDGPTRHEIVTKLDDLIGGLRNALGIERQS
jgi:hypothetical protein